MTLFLWITNGVLTEVTDQYEIALLESGTNTPRKQCVED